MATSYEDNFGFWEIACPEEHAFFEHVKSQSVGAICQRCDRLRPAHVDRNYLRSLRLPRSNAAHPPTTMSKYRHAGRKTALAATFSEARSRSARCCFRPGERRSS